MKAAMIPKINVLGVGISTLTLGGAVETFLEWKRTHQKGYVSVCTVHTVMECQYDSEMKQAVTHADIATPDGMPLAWLGQWKGNQPVTRVYGPDLMLALCEASIAEGGKHYFYGGAPDVVADLVANLKSRFSELDIVGAYSPPYRALSEDEKQQDVDTINASEADYVWVGLGTPKQDLWMAENRPKLNATALFGIGAAFDFHAGRKAQAPKWMQRSGLEWLFRLATEPSRLWRRYLIYNPLFLFRLAQQLLGLKQYTM